MQVVVSSIGPVRKEATRIRSLVVRSEVVPLNGGRTSSIILIEWMHEGNFSCRRSNDAVFEDFKMRGTHDVEGSAQTSLEQQDCRGSKTRYFVEQIWRPRKHAA